VGTRIKVRRGEREATNGWDEIEGLKRRYEESREKSLKFWTHIIVLKYRRYNRKIPVFRFSSV
jgi:hypothetical protein